MRRRNWLVGKWKYWSQTVFEIIFIQYRKKYLEQPQNRSMEPDLKLFARRKDGSEFAIELSMSTYEIDGGAISNKFYQQCLCSEKGQRPKL
jgi:hypothetical protein